MGEDLGNDRRLFDGGNDLQGAPALVRRTLLLWSSAQLYPSALQNLLQPPQNSYDHFLLSLRAAPTTDQRSPERGVDRLLEVSLAEVLVGQALTFRKGPLGSIVESLSGSFLHVSVTLSASVLMVDQLSSGASVPTMGAGSLPRSTTANRAQPRKHSLSPVITWVSPHGAERSTRGRDQDV